jgi:hypothetical protein
MYPYNLASAVIFSTVLPSGVCEYDWQKKEASRSRRHIFLAVILPDILNKLTQFILKNPGPDVIKEG